MNENDFQMNGSGRSGTITYASEGSRVEIYWEMSGVPQYDILLAPIDLREWTEPKGVKLQSEDQKSILRKLRKWTKERKLKTDIDLPDNLELEDKACAWMGCNERRLMGLAYCPRHYDESLLRR